ncbi:TolC family protein [uncultured Alistipes sp.]|uniref:TolC family protein n=2 Tax=uncultured Alistipes sp. TaxID=538949 RepID=UPI0026141A6C|nr:TolC family protein [uncultured Alistipes sp.]
MKTRLLFPTLALLLVALRASGQAPVALDDYCAAVDAYSRQLKIAAARSDEASEELGRARTGRLPRLTLDGNFTAVTRNAAGGKLWTFDLGPQVVQTLYGGGGVGAAIDGAELGYDAARSDEEFTRSEVRYAAEYAYWNLSAMRLYVASMREYVGVIRSLKRVVDRRFEEGYIARGDVLMIDTRLGEAEYRLANAEQRADVALHDFNVLRGEAPDAAVTLAASIRDSLPEPLRVATGEVLDRRADYAAARLRSEQAAAGVRSAVAPFNPQLSVGAGAAWQPSAPNVSGRTYLDGVAFVRLSVPLFRGGERRRAAAAARAVQRQSEWRSEQLRDDIVRQESDGWTALRQSIARLGASARNLRVAGENLSISTYSYGEGMTTVLDVLQAQLSWIQLYTNDIEARFDRAVAEADYRRITARP